MYIIQSEILIAYIWKVENILMRLPIFKILIFLRLVYDMFATVTSSKYIDPLLRDADMHSMTKCIFFGVCRWFPSAYYGRYYGL